MLRKRTLIDFEAMNKQVCKSAQSFNAALKGMANLLPEMIDEILREMLEILYLDVAGEGDPPTPIKTGRARTGWVLDAKESEWVPPIMDKEPKSAEEILSAARRALAELPMSDVYYLYNNVPYILVLERGHSDQAPQGFIALALNALAVELEKRAKDFAR